MINVVFSVYSCVSLLFMLRRPTTQKTFGSGPAAKSGPGRIWKNHIRCIPNLNIIYLGDRPTLIFKISGFQSLRGFCRPILYARLKLIVSKCMPILLYGLEACQLTKADICSLDFTVNRVFMKLFRNIEVVRDCQVFFNFDLPSMLLRKRTNKFIGNYRNSGNDLCKFLCTS